MFISRAMVTVYVLLAGCSDWMWSLES